MRFIRRFIQHQRASISLIETLLFEPNQKFLRRRCECPCRRRGGVQSNRCASASMTSEAGFRLNNLKFFPHRAAFDKKIRFRRRRFRGGLAVVLYRPEIDGPKIFKDTNGDSDLSFRGVREFTACLKNRWPTANSRRKEESSRGAASSMERWRSI